MMQTKIVEALIIIDDEESQAVTYLMSGQRVMSVCESPVDDTEVAVRTYDEITKAWDHPALKDRTGLDAFKAWYERNRPRRILTRVAGAEKLPPGKYDGTIRVDNDENGDIRVIIDVKGDQQDGTHNH